ncbi:MAG: YfhO family protein [Bacteroidales bacterium]|nr:YfhO family protein [Bacteroidales bacterium]
MKLIYKTALFSLIIIVSFWQVAFLQNSLKWDFIDAFLPARYFFSESILNNQFPLWNPYLLNGIPTYADLVSVFNPEFWIVSNMFGYSNITLQFIYLFYILIAGLNFQLLITKLYPNNSKWLSYILSISYMLSGVVVGNSQNLAVISGYALIPLVYLIYYLFLEKNNLKKAISVVLITALMSYTSYPALTIILAYLLFFTLLYFIISKKSNKKFLINLLKYHLIIFALLLIVVSPLLISYWQAKPFISQYSGLSQEIANQHAFTPQSLISFVLPFATGKEPSFFGTDISMSNGYFGIISLLLMVLSLVNIKKKKENILFLFLAIFSLIASFGDGFYLRNILFDFFPLMDSFRYPSLFRVFTIFFLILFIASSDISYLLSRNKKQSNIISLVIILFIGLAVFWSYKQIDSFVYFSDISFIDALKTSTIYDNIILQGIIQITILLVFLTINNSKKVNLNFHKLLFLIVVIDLFVATQLNIRYTVVEDKDPIKFSEYLKVLPKGFPLPDLKPQKLYNDKSFSNEFIWLNAGVFPKKPSYDGLISFKLNGFNYLTDNEPELFKATLNEGILFLSSDIKSTNDIKNYNSNTLFFADSVYQLLSKTSLKSSNLDSLNIYSFSPKHISAKVFNKNRSILTYQQNYFPGWHAYIDDIETPIYISNFTLMSIEIPNGKHTISFVYKNYLVLISYVVVIIIVISMLLWLILLSLKNNKTLQKKYLILSSFIILIFVSSTTLNRTSYNLNKEGFSKDFQLKLENIVSKYNNVNSLLCTKDQNFKNSGFKQILNIDRYNNLNRLNQILQENDSKYFVFAWSNEEINNELIELVNSYFSKKVESDIFGSSGFILFEKDINNNSYFIFDDFESEDNSDRIYTDTLSNNRLYQYFPDQEWGKAYEISTSDINVNKVEGLFFIADIYTDDSSSSPIAVVSIEENGQSIYWQGFEIKKYLNKKNMVSRFSFEYSFNTPLKSNQLIKIYVWNKSSSYLLIDNVKIKLKEE